MAEEEKTWRTNAYYTEDRRNYDLVFWVMSPAYKKPGFQIKKHEIGRSGSTISRIADELPEQEALLKMEELDRTAAEKLTRANEENVDILKRLGADFKNADPHQPRAQAVITEINAARLRLRNRNPGLKLKR